jgi:hypothetical protein
MLKKCSIEKAFCPKVQQINKIKEYETEKEKKSKDFKEENKPFRFSVINEFYFPALSKVETYIFYKCSGIIELNLENVETVGVAGFF